MLNVVVAAMHRHASAVDVGQIDMSEGNSANEELLRELAEERHSRGSALQHVPRCSAAGEVQFKVRTTRPSGLQDLVRSPLQPRPDERNGRRDASAWSCLLKRPIQRPRLNVIGALLQIARRPLSSCKRRCGQSDPLSCLIVGVL